MRSWRAAAGSILLTPWLAVASAQEPRLLVMAAGDCADAQLTQSLTELTAALARRPRAKVFTLAQLRPVLGAAPERSHEELWRQVVATQMALFNAQYAKAEATAFEALEHIERLRPNPVTAQMTLDLHVLLAITYRGQGRSEAYQQTIRRILNVRPNFNLDNSEYPPSVRKEFHAVRHQMANGPRHPLDIRSSPPGAEVFIDGVRLGTTPLTARLPPAVYRLVLVQDGRSTLTRTLELEQSRELEIDAGFEVTIDERRLPCLNLPSQETARLVGAAKLGTLVGASEVVVVWLERRDARPDWLAATLVSLPDTRKVREGGLKRNHEPLSSAHLDELASFVLTGAASGPVKAKASTTEEWRSLEPSSSLSAPGSPWSWRRLGAIGVGAAGLVAAGLGVDALVVSGSEWRAYNAYYANGQAPTREQLPQVTAIRSSAQAHQARGTWLLVAGGAAAAGGTLWWLLDRPASPSLGWSVGPTGVSAAASFHWP